MVVVIIPNAGIFKIYNCRCVMPQGPSAMILCDSRLDNSSIMFNILEHSFDITFLGGDVM